MRLSSILILSAALTQPILAQNDGKLSPLIRQQLIQTTAQHKVLGTGLVPVFIQIDDDAALDALRQMGVSISRRAGDVVSARVPMNVLGKLGSVPGVRYVDGAVSVRPMLDKARAATGVDRIHQAEGLTQAYTGKGVMVGVVDAGFDYRHPAYRTSDEEGAPTRILRVWEQNLDDGTAHPEGFEYGGELVGNDRLIAAQGDVVTSSHGGHVLGIAAGREYQGNGWGGVAPEADIALVSMGTTQEGNVNIADGVAYLFDVAKQNDEPSVVNLSLGTQIGPHDGTSLFDRMTDAMQGEGRILVGAAGNFGTEPMHVAATGGNAIKAKVDFISNSNRQGKLDVWGTPGQPFKVQVQVVKNSTGEFYSGTELLDASAEGGAAAMVTLTGNAKGTVGVATEVNPNNNRPHALIDMNITQMRYGYSIVLYIEPAGADNRVDAWADGVYLQFDQKPGDGYEPGDTERTFGEIGGTGKRIITVGSYNTRTEYTTAGSTSTSTVPDETVGHISAFSSAGPSLDGRMKPDVVAPGCLIISALNGNSISLSSELLAGYVTYEGHTQCWGYMQGTSMASPFVAGTVALWLQANATLTPEQVRDVLAHSCTPVDASDPLAARGGYGKLDAWAGLKYVVSTVGIHNAKADAAQSFSVRRGQGCLDVLFASSTQHTAVQLYSASGALLRTVPVNASLGEVSIPTASLPSGSYVLRVDGQSVKVAL